MITYRFKLRPNPTQEAALWKTLRLSRELYNDALAELRAHYESTGKYLEQYEHDKRHTIKEHPEMPSQVVDATLARLHLSFKYFFQRCKTTNRERNGLPRFKTANRWHSFQFRDAVNNGISDSYFKSGKKLGGRIRFNRHRDIKGIVKFCRVVRKPSGWYLQVICESQPERLPITGRTVGLDFGVRNLVADSNGHLVENPRFIKRSLRKLRAAQRRIERREKGSNRYKKACRGAARIHERICNQRYDYLHKVARSYVNQYDTIIIEDLRPSNMARTRQLAQSVLDASWGILRQMLESKAENAGRRVVAVSPKYTTQRCSQCGEITPTKLAVTNYCCAHCGHSENRDLNAAKNILHFGSDGAVGEAAATGAAIDPRSSQSFARESRAVYCEN